MFSSSSSSAVSGELIGDKFCFDRKTTEKIYTCLKTTTDFQVQIEKLQFCPIVEPKTFFETETGKLILFSLGAALGVAAVRASK